MDWLVGFDVHVWTCATFATMVIIVSGVIGFVVPAFGTRAARLRFGHDMLPLALKFASAQHGGGSSFDPASCAPSSRSPSSEGQAGCGRALSCRKRSPG